MRSGAEVIDADGHVWEPVDLWDRYIDREFVVQFKEGPYEFMIRRDARSDRSPGARALASGGDDVRGTGSERAAPRRNSRGASRQNHQAARSAPGTQTS